MTFSKATAQSSQTYPRLRPLADMRADGVFAGGVNARPHEHMTVFGWNDSGIENGPMGLSPAISVTAISVKSSGVARPMNTRALPNVHFAMTRMIALVVLMIALAACGKKQPVVQPPPEIRTVTVEVPTIVKATPPAELLAAIKPPLPVFISPFDPDATSALTADGERQLRGLIEELLQRIAAWKAWASTP